MSSSEALSKHVQPRTCSKTSPPSYISNLISLLRRLMILYALGAAYHASSSLQPWTQGLTTRAPDSMSIFTDRSIYGIIWSCFATIFACTWISVHPNIPAPQDGALRVIGRRMAIMAYLLIAPEMVIVWTTRQYLGASDIAKRHRDKGWTKVHAFFLLMGGFSLYENGALVRTLEALEFERLLEEGKIDWPTITEEEIKDKSKGDPFSKGIVVLQTTWFIVQCIMRGAKHLVLTELEIVTLAFSAITMGIYALWWNKPLDVQVSVPVHLKQIKAVGSEEERETVDNVDLPSQPAENLVREERQGEQSPLLENILDTTHDPNTPNVEVPLDSSSIPIEEKPESLATTPAYVKKPFRDPNLTAGQNLLAYIREKRKEHGLFFGLIYVFILRPGVIFFAPFVDMMTCTTLEGKQYRVPTFYSPVVADDSNSIVFALLVALVFGGIHCIAWSFHFPSWTERWLWRISAVLVSGLPVSISFLSVFMDGGDQKYDSRWAKFCSDLLAFVLISSAILYVAARVALLVLPLIALRALPPGAYVDINWTAYLPHI